MKWDDTIRTTSVSIYTQSVILREIVFLGTALKITVHVYCIVVSVNVSLPPSPALQDDHEIGL